MSEFIFASTTHVPLDGHLWHIVLLGSLFPIFAIIVVIEKTNARRRARRSHSAFGSACATRVDEVTTPQRRSSNPTWLQFTALASLSAALVHAAVMPDHFEQSFLYGLFFLIAATSQLFFCVMTLWKPSRRLVKAGVIASALMILLWLASRTLGVPIGPDNGNTEAWGLLDSLASIYELAIVVFGALALRSGKPYPVWRWSTWKLTARLVAPICIVGTVIASLISSRS
jgi:hypothetical protein